MARGKGGSRANSGRGGSLNTFSRQPLVSPTVSHSSSGRDGLLNTSLQQPLSPLTIPHVLVEPVAPRIPASTLTRSVPAAANVPPSVPGAIVRPHALASAGSENDQPMNAPDNPLEDDYENVNHANDRPRKTRGMTLGVDAPKNGEDKILIIVLKTTLIPAEAISKIGMIFKRHFKKVRTKWSHWSGELNDMWADYLRYFRFATHAEEEKGRIVWEKKAACNFPKYMFGWKRNALKKYGSIEVARNHPPEWTTSDVWKPLCDYWLGHQFSEASLLRKRNRSSIKNIPHTTGRVTHEEIDLKLVASLGRPPTQIERFTETHVRKNKSKENNEKIWVSKDAEKLEKAYARELREMNKLEPQVPVNAILHPGCVAVPDPGCTAWQVVVGGVKKGRLFGRPGEKWKKRSGCASSVDYAAYVSSQNSNEEIKKLKEKVDQESKEKKELKAYVASMAPLWAEMAARCGMVCPPPPLFSNASSSTPSSDGGSNIPMMTSPFDDDGENDADFP